LRERSEDMALRRSNPGNYLLSGLLRCGRCKRAYVGMSAKGNGGTYHYYACSGRQKLGPKACDGERIPRDKLEAAVVAQLAGLYRNVDVIQEAIEASAAQRHTDVAALEEQRRGLAEEIRRAERTLDRYYAAFETGDLDAKRFQTRVSALESRLADLGEQDLELAARLAPEPPRAPDTANLAAVADRLEDVIGRGDPKQAKALLRLLVKGLRVNGRREILPTYRVVTDAVCALPSSVAEWCELVKDLVAMANTGGGVIVIGVRDDGRASGADITEVLALDPATITDKIHAYTREHFAGFDVLEVRRGRRRVAAITIDAVDVPLVFASPGTYPDATKPGKQKTAFSRGTIYFRHGAKSEPAVSTDIAGVIERRLDRERETLLRNVRRVVEAPPGTEILPIRRGVLGAEGQPTAIQLTTDPGAPIYGRLDPDQTHPYRQKEAIIEINEKFAGDASVNTYDMQAIRAVHEITEERFPEFVHQPRYASQQYSDGFVDWVVDQIARDNDFLADARRRYQRLR
jgi:hypothetical protein